VDAAPLERDRSVSLERLLERAANLTITEEETATLASRLAKLELQLSLEERSELDSVAKQSVRDIVRGLVDAVDPDTQANAAAGAADTEAAVRRLIDNAVRPLASNPELRQRILELRRSHDLVIDDSSIDVLLDAHGVVDTGRARSVVDSWRTYLDQHRSEVTAIQVLYEGHRSHVTFAELRELAERIKRPPHQWTPHLIWTAYETLDAGRVKHSDRNTVADLVSLIRFTLGVDNQLVPYAERVHERYQGWLLQQQQAGARFSDRQRWWLDRIADVIATSAGITEADLDNAPFTERGGIDGVIRDFGDRASAYLSQLNEELTA
jgi:type I restriction enzyme R subunit